MTIQHDPGGPPAAARSVTGSTASDAVLAAALGAASVLTLTGSDAYRFLIGGVSPVLATLVVTAVGAGAIRSLRRARWFMEPAGAPANRWRLPAALGAGLTLPALVVDMLGGFPRDLNVSLPASLLFYPSIAVVAVLAFHVIPIALLDVPGRTLGPDGRTRLRRAAMGIACLPEPVLQVAWGIGRSPTWVNGFVAVHLLAFNLLGVVLLRRRGFPAAVLYRLSYYLIWHILWGAARVELLF